MFENYKKQSEGDSRYGRIALAAFVAGIIYIAVFIFVTGAFESNTPQTVRRTTPEGTIVEPSADELCASLPNPERLEFTGKSEPKNDYEQHLVIYDYRSARRPEEILPVFLFWFNENGWQRVAGTETTFRNGNSSIYLRYESTPSITNYSIYCSEKK